MLTEQKAQEALRALDGHLEHHVVGVLLPGDLGDALEDDERPRDEREEVGHAERVVEEDVVEVRGDGRELLAPFFDRGDVRRRRRRLETQPLRERVSSRLFAVHAPPRGDAAGTGRIEQRLVLRGSPPHVFREQREVHEPRRGCGERATDGAQSARRHEE